MGGAVSTGQDNDDLIDNLLQADYIRSPTVERVFRAVDRADYFLPDARGNAYKDLAWKCGHLHLSAPCIYSEVMEGLCLEPGLSFLNLGSGTGYLSTMAGLILGSNGVNHGVEIHEDVVQYAVKKLEDFKKYSGAIDEFDFCEPKFIQGNCLCLTSDRQYDRVYCGAACPEPYETYMKNLLRVGGVLVLPMNDHLIKIKRTSEVTWGECCLLPVSFATLILPPEGKQEMVDMFDVVPLSLQSLSRSVIRSILRKIIEAENPNLKKKPPAVKHTKRKERALRRLVVPIFDDSGDDPFSSDDERQHVGRGNNRRTANNIFDIIMDHLGYRGQADASNRNESNGSDGHVENMEVEAENAEARSAEATAAEAVAEQEPSVSSETKVSDEEKDVNKQVIGPISVVKGEIADLLQEMKDEHEDDDEEDEHENNEIEQVFVHVLQELEQERQQTGTQVNEEELQADMNNLEVYNKDSGNSTNCDESATVGDVEAGTSSGVTAKKDKREKFDSGFGEEIIEKDIAVNTDSSDHENMEFESSSSSNDDNDGKRNKRGSKHNGEVRSGAKWRRICLSAHRYDSFSSSSDSETVQEEVNTPANESRTVVSPYSSHMRAKIQQLPLPTILKNYLNFYREF